MFKSLYEYKFKIVNFCAGFLKNGFGGFWFWRFSWVFLWRCADNIMQKSKLLTICILKCNNNVESEHSDKFRRQFVEIQEFLINGGGRYEKGKKEANFLERCSCGAVFSVWVFFKRE